MALVIVHGLGRHAAEWTAIARALDPDAVVPDLPELRVVDRAPDQTAVIRSLVDELDRRDLSAATWIGHSGGGHVVAQLAAQHPARAHRAIVIAVVLPASVRAQIACPLHVIDSDDHDPHLTDPAALLAQLQRLLP